MTRGFLLGKFMPPHEGHLALCRAAAALCDELTVLVCTRDVEPIPGRLRAAVMAECLPGVRIAWMNRDVPQEPADHPDFWPVWCGIVAEHCPLGVDRVFGSEPYVLRLADELGAEACLIDPDRLGVPVSGTAVRNDPAGQWRWIPGPLRPWYQKRLVVLGAPGVGKTTLTRALATHANGPFVPDGRSHRRVVPRDDGAAAMVRVHLALRSAIAPLAGPVLIEDTDPLVAAVQSLRQTGRSAGEIETGTRLADHYVLLDADVPWAADPAASMQERSAFQGALRTLLDVRGARYCVATGSGAARLATGLQALERLRSEPFPGRWSLDAGFHPVHAVPAA